MFRYVRITPENLRVTVINTTGDRWGMQGFRDLWFEALAVAVISLALFLIVVIVTS